MKRIALGVQYDGTPWRGWQSQAGGGTVQDELEAALARFTQQQLRTVCAGRTDAGVHAVEQVVHFDTDIARDAYSWVRGVNSFLPDSIAVRWACEIPLDLGHPDQGFHARFSATARRYHYLLYNNKIRSPLWNGRAGWAFRPLDVAPMREAAQLLVGEHDFSAFRAAGCQAKSPVKTMHSVQIERYGDLVVFTLHASAFLHHMVRNLVGSLIYVGNGTENVAWFGDVLASRNRRLAAPTYMPDGLYLARIDYPPQWVLPQADMSLPWL
ncbi:MAG TPA: tRNA pseudouridine(38-40) synthase TruA [Burkholderiaceae bacterium]